MQGRNNANNKDLNRNFPDQYQDANVRFSFDVPHYWLNNIVGFRETYREWSRRPLP
jgi:hypothetical protein